MTYVYFKDANGRCRAACAYEIDGDLVLYATSVLSRRDKHDKAIVRRILDRRLAQLRAEPGLRCFYKQYNGESEKNPVIVLIQGNLPQYNLWFAKIGVCDKAVFQSRLNSVRYAIKELDDE